MSGYGFAPPPGGMPGAPGMPGTAPPGMAPGGAPAVAPGQPFVLMIPEDQTYEPYDRSDVLEKDGYFQCRITSDAAKQINGRLQVVVTLEIQDEDFKGRKIARFLPDPRTTEKNTWFLYRGLIHSITNDLNVAKKGMQYTSGMFTGQLCYVKTKAYMDDNEQRTGVDAWVLANEWQEAVRTNRHRWAVQVQAPRGAGMGATPAGLAPGFPGMPGVGAGGLPGAPTTGMPALPQAGTVPQPMGAPMQMPATAPPQAPPPAAVVPQAPYTPPQAPAYTPPQASFGFPSTAGAAPQAPQAPQPPQGFAMPGAAAAPPQANGAQTAAAVVGGFPGMPGVPPRQ